MLIVVIALLAVGIFASLSGALGVVRMPDVYNRLQYSSKAITLGAIPVLIAVTVGMGVDTEYAARSLIIAVLLLVFGPTAAHAVSRAAYKTGVAQWPGARANEPARRR
jgi:multicomponent Na+:H+ antiporter subunit G